MAASGGIEPPIPPQIPSSQEVFKWLKNLPLAPEYHPTLAEFQDPIAYIFKIEKEASKYGICKIVPPLLPSPKKATISNLNRSLASRSASNTPTFTTRQQQIGFCPRRPRPVQKPVWQSGEYYTFQEFEAKAKSFEKNYLKKCYKKGQAGLSPLEIETLYWKATVDKPFTVEYANDMPGSAFSAWKSGRNGGEGVTIGETEWNMRVVSRAKGSLLRFMKEEIPGVTSPMVYIAMLFSWFAWHVEDHDLHSLNYLHMGSGKTWYGVPREAAVAFEEVVRVHGYGGEYNPLVTFAVLGEKTTVISPEVFISAGVPCCRLVQNAGEFVVTFPRAYHSGFSHGFNCGEASNIATPEWLRVAKDAAIRRASINYPPMVSHFQLLYDLALELCTSIPMSISSKPRSSRLKDKQKVEGETLVKDLFVKNVAHNSSLLHRLVNGSSVVILPHSFSVSLSSNLRIGSQLNLNSSLVLSNHKRFVKSLKSPVPCNIMSGNNGEVTQNKGLFSVKGKFDFVFERDTQTENVGSHSGSDICGDKLSDQRLFSCVTCGVLSFDCVAIVQPSKGAARHLMSADCSFFNDWIVGSGVTSDKTVLSSRDMCAFQQTSSAGLVRKVGIDGLHDVSFQPCNYETRTLVQNMEAASNDKPRSEGSALGLLAVNYGDSSDSEEDQCDPDVCHGIDETNLGKALENKHHLDNSSLPSLKQVCDDVANGSSTPSVSTVGCKDEAALQTIDFHANDGRRVANLKDTTSRSPDHSVEFETDHVTSKGVDITFRGLMPSSNLPSVASLAPRSDEDSCRMHVFCLEHAIEVEQQLGSIGGARILLLCHPEYPRIESEAKSISEELGIDYKWNEITYRESAMEDEEMIKSALNGEENMPGNGDWAVKLGINLFYSANLSQSSLYAKQMPYNSVIYNAFGCTTGTSPAKHNVYARRPARQRKVVVGRWCGKVWMSNQVHPLLATRDPEDQEQERSCLDLVSAGENLERRVLRAVRSRNTSASRKSGRKRKVASRSASVKKFKCLEEEDAISDQSDGSDLSESPLKTSRRRKTKFSESEELDGSEDSSHQKHGRIHRNEQVKPVERDEAVSDDSFEDNSNRPRRRTVFRKEVENTERDNGVTNNLAKSSSRRQHRRVQMRKQAKLVKESVASDDEHGWQGRVQRSRLAEFIDSEDALSDDSPEGNSHWSHSRSKQAFYAKEDSASDDLPDDSLLYQVRRVPRGNNFKPIEDALSDDSVEEDTYQKQVRSHRSKVGKFVEREIGVSDNNSDQQLKIRGSKKCKVAEWREVSVDDDINQNRKRIFRNKKANFSQSEDAVSDDSMVDITQKSCVRVHKGKKARFVDDEDVASDDLEEDNFYQQSREPPRGKKQVKYLESAAGSDDSLEKNNQQKSRFPKSRRKKPITLGLTKRKNTHTVKQSTQRSTKKVPSKSIKIERQLMQETPQLWKNKHEQHDRDYDSQVEEDQNGGPSTRLRKRPSKRTKESEPKMKEKVQSKRKRVKNTSTGKHPASGRKNLKVKDEETLYQCDIEGCSMGFDSKQDLSLHKKNICPVEGCGKKFFSHKYLVQHRRVHLDDRPLKCPWKGCKMTFKWAWARTEHIRVHTGARPYICSEEGCGQTFRFVSDFSRHKRKTGHSAKRIRG